MNIIGRLLLVGLLALLAAGAVFAQDDDPLDCGGVLEIWQIQGSGDEANCLRSRVQLAENVVTAVGPGGFFMQSPAERIDGDPYTSDGVYVQTATPPTGWGIQVGDLVNIDAGRVQEVYGTTMIAVTSPTQVVIVSSGNPVPQPVDLFSVDYTDYGPASHPMERYEGMLVQATAAVVVAPTNQFDEFGISLTNQRVFREPGIEPDRTPEFAGRGLPEWDLNPELLEVIPTAMGLPPVQLVPGSVVSVTGGIAYNYQDYQIFPRDLEVSPIEFSVTPVRPRAAGEVTVATFNAENLFDTVDDPDRDDSTFENYVPANMEEYTLRLDKVGAYIRTVLDAPDILALQEVENARVLADLIARMRVDEPTLRYTTCFLEGNEGRGIDVAYLVRVDRINLLDCYRIPGSYTETLRGSDVLFSRPPLVLEAEVILPDGVGFPLTLVNNHIKSLSGIETAATQERRELQAVRVAEFVGGLFEADPAAHVIVLGDLNAFPFTDGIVDVVGIISGTHDPEAALRAPARDTLEPDLINWVTRLPAEEQYSYNFNGSYQVLDHILTSPALEPYVTGAQFGRGNADVPEAWFLDPDVGALRASDHDGFVIYITPVVE
ncbi:MAG: endonuclease/exonuclease/phosphatase family protein [Chloroflexota bacterium]